MRRTMFNITIGLCTIVSLIPPAGAKAPRPRRPDCFRLRHRPDSPVNGQPRRHVLDLSVETGGVIDRWFPDGSKILIQERCSR